MFIIEQEIETIKTNHILKIEEIYNEQKKKQLSTKDQIIDNIISVSENWWQTSKEELFLLTSEIVNISSKEKEMLLNHNWIVETQTEFLELFNKETNTDVVEEIVYSSIKLQVSPEMSPIEAQTEHHWSSKDTQTESIQILEEIGINTDKTLDLFEEKKSDLDLNFNLSLERIPAVETATVQMQTFQITYESKEVNTSIEEERIIIKDFKDQEINTSFEILLKNSETKDVELNTSSEIEIDTDDKEQNTSFQIIQEKPETQEIEVNTSLEEIKTPKEFEDKDQNTSFEIESKKIEVIDEEINTSIEEIEHKEFWDQDQNTTFEIQIVKPESNDEEVNTSFDDNKVDENIDKIEKSDQNINTSFDFNFEKPETNDAELNTSNIEESLKEAIESEFLVY